jgi:glycosyltransferase involved in cell wall biosynthesis
LPADSAYLIVLPWEPNYPGGVNEVVHNLLRCIGGDGTWRPALLVSSWEHRRPVTLEETPVPTIMARLQNPFWHFDSFSAIVKSALMTPRSLQRLGEILARHRVAIVNLHYANSNVWSFILLRSLLRRRFRLILSFHGMDVETIRNASPLGRRAWTRALAACDAVVCCSHALARELTSIEPQLGNRVAVIHNGIDERSVLAEVAPAALPVRLGARPYIACVATFEQKKGIDVLVRAFARLAAAFPDTDLVLAGRTKGEHTRIEALIAELGLTGRVQMLIDVPHPVALRIIGQARAFVLPSRREPFGIVLLEAGLLGTPLVATAVGGVSEVIIDGETGRLVPADDAGALAEAIRAALTDEAGSRRMAQAMRERVRTQFSWEAAFAKYRALADGPGS